MIVILTFPKTPFHRIEKPQCWNTVAESSCFGKFILGNTPKKQTNHNKSLQSYKVYFSHPNDHWNTTILCPHHELTNVPSILPYWRAQQSEYQGIPLPRHYLFAWCHMMSQWKNMSHRIFKKTYSPLKWRKIFRTKKGWTNKNNTLNHCTSLEGLTVRPWKATRIPIGKYIYSSLPSFQLPFFQRQTRWSKLRGVYPKNHWTLL